MKDLTGKTVFYWTEDFDGVTVLAKVKLTYHKNKNERDLDNEDEYEGEVVKTMYGRTLDPSVLYVSDMIFTDKKLISTIWERLKLWG